MIKSLNFIKHKYDLIAVTLLALWLRFVNLGYSDLQGDEIKALFIPEEGQSIANFLLTQRKGPIQFLITYLLKFLTPDYSNRFLLRFPFAIAGTLAVIFFYKLLEIHFSKRIAFFGSFFLATNGFFIAFSRIVQYQSFVILWMVLALYFFALASSEESWKRKGLFLGFISWALSALSHYDAVFIGPFVLYSLFLWSQKYGVKTIKNLAKELFLPVLTFSILILVFYIPFILELSKATLSYWETRLDGTGGKISSSIYLFRAYQPIYIIHIYTILSFLGCLKLLLLSFRDFKAHNSRNIFLSIGLLSWLLFPFIFMEIIVDIPGTHIYTYLVPLFILLALGISFIQDMLQKLLSKIVFSKFLFWLGIFVMFSFIFAQSHQIYVDHKKEYPWENEKFFIWTFSSPIPTFHLSMFGFPYFRHWDAISQYISSTESNGYYSTDERESISRYHISLNKSADEAGYYVYIKNPQSFEGKITNKKVLYWMDKYSPVASFFKDGDPIVEIYYMAPGSLDEIIAQGF